MKYPFEFNELLLTRGTLTHIGFGFLYNGQHEYASINLGEEYIVNIQPEIVEPKRRYIEEHFVSISGGTLYFLHELYEDILSNLSESSLQRFLQLLKHENMIGDLESYLEYKDIMSKFESK